MSDSAVRSSGVMKKADSGLWPADDTKRVQYAHKWVPMATGTMGWGRLGSWHSSDETLQLLLRGVEHLVEGRHVTY